MGCGRQLCGWQNTGVSSLDLNKSDGEHPADVANLALMRISGILASLSALFDDRRSQYAVDVPFVAQSVKALSQLSDEASAALNELYNACDLTLLPPHEEIQDVADEVVEDDHAQIDFNVLRRRVDALANSKNVPLPTVRTADSNPTNDAPATSYEELLQKVTAAEVFANAQASQIDGGETSMLLPILNSLKQDILRMKRVA
jgi:hypothetical protein